MQRKFVSFVMLQDLRFALRLLGRDRWFTVVAAFALSLGIGVNATVFTLVNAVLIRGLPFPNSDRLYLISARNTSGLDVGVSRPDLEDWRLRTRSFSALAGFDTIDVDISDETRAPEQASGTRLTTNAFAVLGQAPILGRDFAPEDERPGAASVVLLGHALWVNRYGGDPGIVGQTIRLDGVPTTVVGIMPEGMQFPTNAELWTPFVPDGDRARRDWRGLEVFGLLRPGMTRAQGQTDTNQVVDALSREFPDTNRQAAGALIETFNERFNGGEIRTVFLALLGAVGFVLLIACANVASLALSRSVRRTRELALRMAVGASRWRVARQMLVESVLIGCVGGVIGLALAVIGVRLFDAAVADVGKPYWIDFRIDYTVIGYLAAICVATGVVFGMAPALQASRTTITEVLNDGGRGSTGGRRARWLTSSLVVAEIALTIVLLVGAGLMVRSFLNMRTLDLGFNPDHLITMRVQLPEARYPDAAARLAFVDDLIPRVAAIPGAEAVALTTAVPPSRGSRQRFEIEGQVTDDSDARPMAMVIAISPSFFQTLGVPPTRGRAFEPTDGAPGSEAAIVNDRFAATYFPDTDPIGRRVRFPTGDDPTPAWRTIVGVSPSIRHNSPQEPLVEPAAYVPYRQSPVSSVSLVVRSGLEPAAVLAAVRSEVQRIDRDQPVSSGQTINQALVRAGWGYRVFGTIFALLAFIALVFSAVGLYAVMSHSVTERTQEIGVRMALGAGRHQVMWLVLRRGLVQLAAGLATGLFGAFFISNVLRSLLVQVEARDPVTFLAITAILSTVAVSACILATSRATRLDPFVALRGDSAQS